MPLIEDYDYLLPPELVAQYPLEKRDASRLLVLKRDGGEIGHAHFRDLPQWLDDRDVLVVNDTRVFPARLNGHKDSGGKVELLLHHLPEAEGNGEVPQAARARATHRGSLRVGQTLNFGADLTAMVLALPQPGVAEVRFTCPGGDAVAAVLAAGAVPLPPYIQRAAAEARIATPTKRSLPPKPGPWPAPPRGCTSPTQFCRNWANGASRSCASPCTWDRGRLCRYAWRTIPGTGCCRNTSNYPRLRPTRLNAARSQGKRLVAVGTTSVRVLEYCASPAGFQAQQGWCDLFIYPGYRFQAVDRMLTNFHLPKSTLLLLVSAFAGRDLILQAYAEAVKEKYRFYSYGDCMLIL